MKAVNQRGRRLGAATLGVLALALAFNPLQRLTAPLVPYIQTVRSTVIADPQIDECSGIAASRRFPGSLWVHNDSGDTARIFLLDANGKSRAVVHFGNATARDWEDIAVTGTGDNAFVYVGDIGNNARRKVPLTIYRFRESQIATEAGRGEVGASTTAATSPKAEQSVVVERMTLRYPDTPYDAETLIATPDGHIVIVTKRQGTSKIFKTAKPFVNGTEQALVPVGDFKFGGEGWPSQLATGGDLSPDGKRVLVRTYTHAYEWKLPSTGDTWRQVWKTTPHRWLLPPMKQGEAISYDADGTRWIATSEGVNAPIVFLSE